MAATDPRGRRIIYMSVPASYNSAEPEQSFEVSPFTPLSVTIHSSFDHQELRIADYIKAYTTTGSPPAPSPPEPVDASTRISLELPLLFQPYTEVEKVPGTLLPSAGIPQNSETAPASVGIDEVFISITCADEFSGHSFEVSLCNLSNTKSQPHVRNYDTGHIHTTRHS